MSPHLKVGWFSNTADADRIIARCNQIGVNYISLSIAGTPSYRETGALDLAETRELQSKLADAGITIQATCMKGHLSRDPEVVLKPEDHRRLIDGVVKSIAVAGELGITQMLHYNYLRAPADPAMDGELWDGLVSVMKEFVAQAEESKVGIGNHGIWRCIPDGEREKAIADGYTEATYRSFKGEKFGGPFFFRTAEHVHRLIEDVPSPYHGVTMCTGMYIHGADLLKEIQQFRDKMFFCQIRDLDGRWPYCQEIFPGEGELDFPDILKGLLNAGYDGFLHPEHLGNPKYPGQDLEMEATQVLKKWVEEVEG